MSSSVKDFEFVTILGQGSFGSVYKVIRKSDRLQYALKRVKLSPLGQKERENALNEIRILASLSDPNIIAYKEAFYEETENSLCIVMEYAGGGDLHSKIASLRKSGKLIEEELAWSYLIQTVKGINYLHKMKILHRDLKSANIFLSEDGLTIKIGDLNVSKVLKRDLVYTQTGTPYYASPEVWSDKPYNQKSDVWSLGCVLYELLTLRPPFRANDMAGLYKKIQRGVYDKITGSYSKELLEIIDLCLQVNPHARPDCDILLSLPSIKARQAAQKIEKLEESVVPQGDAQKRLLSTIKMPINVRNLKGRLPKPRYEGPGGAADVNCSYDLRDRVFKNPVTPKRHIRSMSVDPQKAALRNIVCAAGSAENNEVNVAKIKIKDSQSFIERDSPAGPKLSEAAVKPPLNASNLPLIRRSRERVGKIQEISEQERDKTPVRQVLKAAQEQVRQEIASDQNKEQNKENEKITDKIYECIKNGRKKILVRRSRDESGPRVNRSYLLRIQKLESGAGAAN